MATTQTERVFNDAAPEPFRQPFGCLSVGVSSNKQEFVTAPPDQHVGLAAERCDDVANLREHAIASSVTIDVVDRLQTIEVEHEKHQGPLGIARFFSRTIGVRTTDEVHLFFDLGGQKTPVPESVSGSVWLVLSSC